MTNKQTQRAGDDSTLIQSGGHQQIIINNGPSYSDIIDVVKREALEFFKNNFYELANEAADIVFKRVEKLLSNLFERFKKENPEGIKQAKDPDFQCSLYEAQKSYARSGDEDLGKLLVDLLIERSKFSERDLESLVVNEGILIVSKLTQSQLDILTQLFLHKHTLCTKVCDSETFGEYLDVYLQPLIGTMDSSVMDLKHLEYTGCLVEKDDQHLVYYFLQSYPFIYTDNLTYNNKLKELDEKGYSIIPREELLYYKKHQLESMRSKNLWGPFRFMDSYLSIRSYLKDYCEYFISTGVGSCELTSIGMVLGYFNLKRIVKVNASFSRWINPIDSSLVNKIR